MILPISKNTKIAVYCICLYITKAQTRMLVPESLLPNLVTLNLITICQIIIKIRFV